MTRYLFERYLAPDQLAGQYRRAARDWPCIAQAELRHSIPAGLLFAVGSRETNLTNEHGDRRYVTRLGRVCMGHGVWQDDDQYNTRDWPAFDADVALQADVAAAKLAANHARTGDWEAACNLYNSGSPHAANTAHGDYGPDVLSRLAHICTLPQPAPTPGPDPTIPLEDDMIATDPETGDYWVLTGPEGGVDAYNANSTKGPRYCGNLVDHPLYNAGQGKPEGPAVAIAFWPQGQPIPGLPPGGYIIYTRDDTGAVHAYRFDATTLVPA